MNEMLLPILSFLLGILATVTSQIISRRFGISDARQKKKLEHLQRIRDWMEVYNRLFECEYPNIWELLNPHLFVRKREQFHRPGVSNLEFQDPKNAERVYKALIQFRDVMRMYEDAEKSGCESLLLLSEPDRAVARAMSGRDVEDLDYPHDFEESQIFPKGLAKALAPHLAILRESKIKIYKRFPDLFAYHISWDKLDDVTPDNILSVVILISPPLQSTEDLKKLHEMWDEREALRYYKSQAREAIKKGLREIQKYEIKWALPD